MQEDNREKKEQQTPKKVKMPKEKKAQRPQPEKNRVLKPVNKPHAARKGKSSAGAIACVVLVVLVLAGAALIYFNVGGIGEIVVEVLSINLPQDETENEGPTVEELLKIENDLKKFEETLEKRKERLDKKDNELSVQGKELLDRERTISERIAAFEEESDAVYALAEEQASLKAAAQIFEQMDAEKAAEVLSKQRNMAYIADLLKAMADEKAALILDNMDATLANRVLTEMME